METRIVNAMIFTVILYGCETWTKTRVGPYWKKIDACMRDVDLEKDAEGLLDLHVEKHQ